MTNIPHDIQFGCDPRDQGLCGKRFGDGDFPTYIDRGIKILPPNMRQAEAGFLDRDLYVRHTFRQLSTMCTSNGLAQGMMMIRAFQGLKHVVLAPEDIFMKISRPGRGSSIYDNVRRAMDVGIRTRAQVPRSSNVKYPPDYEKDSGQNIILEATDLGGGSDSDVFDAIITALHQLWVPLFGIRWKGGGGHALAAASWRKDTDELSGPNSWGKDWGDDGFYHLTRRECPGLAQFGAIAIRAVTWADSDPRPPVPGE